MFAESLHSERNVIYHFQEMACIANIAVAHGVGQMQLLDSKTNINLNCDIRRTILITFLIEIDQVYFLFKTLRVCHELIPVLSFILTLLILYQYLASYAVLNSLF